MSWIPQHLAHRIPGKARRTVAPMVVLTAATFYFFYPISLAPQRLILGRPFEDSLESIWYLYWYKHALFDLARSPLFTTDIFYPGGWNLVYAVLPPTYPLLLTPITAILGPVLTYNLAIMGCCLVTAWGVYRLTVVLGVSQTGALLAAIGFTFYPQRQMYMHGHLNFLFGSMWLPWILYALVQAGEKTPIRTRATIQAGFFLVASLLGAWHFLFLTVIPVAIWALVVTWPSIRRDPRSWRKGIGVAALSVLLIIGPILAYALWVRASLGSDAQLPFSVVDHTSTSIDFLWTPNGWNPLYQWLFQVDRSSRISPGYWVMALAFVGLLSLRPWTRPVIALVMIALTGGILLLGTTLYIHGEAVSIPLETIQYVTKWLPFEKLADEAILLRMPAYLLYRLIPPFRDFHNFDRWSLLWALGLSVLAGLGLTKVLLHVQIRAKFFVAVLALAILIAELNPHPMRDVSSVQSLHRSVDDWLAAQPESSVIIEYPLSYAQHGQALYYTMAHGQIIVHGYSSVRPSGYRTLLPTLETFPNPDALNLLAKIGVKYVLFDKFIYPGQEEMINTLLQEPRLHLVAQFDTQVGWTDQIYLFELRQETPSK